MRYSRRELIEMVFGSAALATFAAANVGCDSLDSFLYGRLPPCGELLTPNHAIGHRLRPPVVAPEMILSRDHESAAKHHCVIIGAGVAGLSAAWHLQQNGVDDFVVFELESAPGGTSRGGQLTDGFAYPWGAHYLPVPSPDNRPLVDFLSRCGVLNVSPDGSVTATEPTLCRDPEERVFAEGRWYEGLYPEAFATSDDLAQMRRFRAEMTRLGNVRGQDNRRWFAIPTCDSSRDAEARRLDQMSMADWMSEHGFDSEPLRWLVDYACRDDYGLHTEQTSAWAGVFYFAARIQDEEGASQPVMTWPNGNGFLVEKLVEPIGDRLRGEHAVMQITAKDFATKVGPLLIEVLDCQTGATSVIKAEHVIVAVPQFIANRILDPTLRSRRELDLDAFGYGSWLVANVHLRDRPAESAFPMAWDNVMMASGSLGYVNSTHQTGRDHGATILTWYQALPSDTPPALRNQLLNLSWAEMAETVLLDLEIGHPDVRSLVERLDVMVWGHAMPQPRVGHVFHPSRQAARQPLGNVHFACTDLSGLALFEEAFDHGLRAATEVAGVPARMLENT